MASLDNAMVIHDQFFGICSSAKGKRNPAAIDSGVGKVAKCQ